MIIRTLPCSRKYVESNICLVILGLHKFLYVFVGSIVHMNMYPTNIKRKNSCHTARNFIVSLLQWLQILGFFLLKLRIVVIWLVHVSEAAHVYIYGEWRCNNLYVIISDRRKGMYHARIQRHYCLFILKSKAHLIFRGAFHVQEKHNIINFCPSRFNCFVFVEDEPFNCYSAHILLR